MWVTDDVAGCSLAAISCKGGDVALGQLVGRNERNGGHRLGKDQRERALCLSLAGRAGLGVPAADLLELLASSSRAIWQPRTPPTKYRLSASPGCSRAASPAQWASLEPESTSLPLVAGQPS